MQVVETYINCKIFARPPYDRKFLWKLIIGDNNKLHAVATMTTTFVKFLEYRCGFLNLYWPFTWVVFLLRTADC